MPGTGAREFLREQAPFRLLDDEALDGFVGSLRMVVYPSGVHILRQGAPSCRTLHVIREGTVRIYATTPTGQERVIDFRGAGESFGFLSRGEDDPIDTSVQAVTDTVCYVADGAAALAFLDGHPELKEYFLPAYFPKKEAGLSPVSPAREAIGEGSETALFTTPVEYLATRDVQTVSSSATVLEAAQLMSARRVGGLVVVDESGLPAGIVTSTDLRDRVLAVQRSPSTPAGEVMSAPLITVGARDSCFEALLKMMSHGVDHLPVMDGGRLAGIVSCHDFLVLQGTSPLVLAREIEGRTTVEGLAASARRVRGLVSLLLREGAGAGSVIRVISAVNDRLEHRILELALETLGPPPVPFCWIVYGSAGRREQTFKTDQDNAIVHADPRNDEEAQAAAEYFGRLAELVVDAFLRCGFALCRGGFMATNPEWRAPLARWKRTFSGWIGTPDEAALAGALNLFDFRGLHGDLRLAAELKLHLHRSLEGQSFFLKAVACQAVDYRPPLGLFGTLQMEKGGDHANQIDLKRCCLTPLVNVVRLLGFESNLAETSTTGRIAALRSAGRLAQATADDLTHAFEFVSLLRIRHQHDQIAMDLEPDNHVDPRQLSSLERSTLKGICRLLSRLLDGIAERYATDTRI